MVDFRKHMGGKKPASKPLRPANIYETLDRASDKGPLRPAQDEVLDEWHEDRRDQQDVVVKLHTGQGKTLIGLLILQSKLNEGLGPAVYLCPNNFLVDQTVTQGEQFGLECVTADPELPSQFLEGQAILVTSVQKLFNGLTKFRLGVKSQPVGALVVDDSHACIDAIREACVARLPKEHRGYDALVALFATSLKKQGVGTFADIRSGRYDALLPVSYWDWIDRHEDVAEILSRDSTTNELKFVWPLIKDTLRDCLCVVSGAQLEIAPYAPPLHLFGSYANAQHRVFMSATVTNDAFLVKGLGLTPQVITDPLLYRSEKWSGEKMILIPSLIDGTLSRDPIVKKFSRPVSGRKFGVVVLTPSFARADDWNKHGAALANKSTIYGQIEGLKAGRCENALVAANRYDGIDLPDRACRILILDSLPYSENLIDRWTESCRSGSEIILTRMARTIEQALGRSVRGDRDYCVVILVGPDLIKTMRTKKLRSLFSPQTRTQIEMGLEIAEYAKDDISEGGRPFESLQRLINQCLKRNVGWKDFYAERMADLPKVDADPRTLEIFAAEQAAENELQQGKPEAAAKSVQDLIDSYVSDPADKGWYLQEMARYTYFSSRWVFT